MLSRPLYSYVFDSTTVVVAGGATPADEGGGLDPASAIAVEDPGDEEVDSGHGVEVVVGLSSQSQSSSSLSLSLSL
jgi:hypothetical protein